MSSADEIELDPDAAKVTGAPEVDAAEPASAVAGAGGVEGAGEIRGSAEIAAALASGRIDAAAAQQLLVDQVIAEQFSGDLDPAALERVRAELAELLADDPALSSLLSPV